MVYAGRISWLDIASKRTYFLFELIGRRHLWTRSWANWPPTVGSQEPAICKTELSHLWLFCPLGLEPMRKLGSKQDYWWARPENPWKTLVFDQDLHSNLLWLLSSLFLLLLSCEFFSISQISVRSAHHQSLPRWIHRVYSCGLPRTLGICNTYPLKEFV
jgi:hypothetical protein